MMTYHFRVIAPLDDREVGSIVEVEMKPSQYDAFKAAYPELERYHPEPIGFKIVDMKAKRGPDGKFMERMDHMRHHYPGAKNMFDNARWSPKREF